MRFSFAVGLLLLARPCQGISDEKLRQIRDWFRIGKNFDLVMEHFNEVMDKISTLTDKVNEFGADRQPPLWATDLQCSKIKDLDLTAEPLLEFWMEHHSECKDPCGVDPISIFKWTGDNKTKTVSTIDLSKCETCDFNTTCTNGHETKLPDRHPVASHSWNCTNEKTYTIQIHKNLCFS